MANKNKKVKVEVKNNSKKKKVLILPITQENYNKEYSFNPFQPYEKHIQTQERVIIIKKKK